MTGHDYKHLTNFCRKLKQFCHERAVVRMNNFKIKKTSLILSILVAIVGRPTITDRQ